MDRCRIEARPYFTMPARKFGTIRKPSWRRNIMQEAERSAIAIIAPNGQSLIRQKRKSVVIFEPV